jgi:hypothetical protein
MKAQAGCFFFGWKVEGYRAARLNDSELLDKGQLCIEPLNIREEVERESDCSALPFQARDRPLEFQEMQAGCRLGTALLQNLNMIVRVVNTPNLS